MLQTHMPAIFFITVFTLKRFQTVFDRLLCFSFDPLLKEFSNRCVFDKNAQLISVNGSSKRIEMCAFLSENALVLTGPKIRAVYKRKK